MHCEIKFPPSRMDVRSVRLRQLVLQTSSSAELVSKRYWRKSNSSWTQGRKGTCTYRYTVTAGRILCSDGQLCPLFLPFYSLWRAESRWRDGWYLRLGLLLHLFLLLLLLFLGGRTNHAAKCYFITRNTLWTVLVMACQIWLQFFVYLNNDNELCFWELA